MRSRHVTMAGVSREAYRLSPTRSTAILAAMQRRCLIAGKRAQAQGLTVKAARLYRRALQLGVAVYGPEHPLVLVSLKNCAAMLRVANREAEALELEKQSRANRAHRGR